MLRRRGPAVVAARVGVSICMRGCCCMHACCMLFGACRPSYVCLGGVGVKKAATTRGRSDPAPAASAAAAAGRGPVPAATAAAAAAAVAAASCCLAVAHHFLHHSFGDPR